MVSVDEVNHQKQQTVHERGDEENVGRVEWVETSFGGDLW